MNGRKFTEDEVCQLLNLKKSTWRQYRSRSWGVTAPPPDGHIGVVREPFWYEETIAEYRKKVGKRGKKGSNGPLVVNRQAYDLVAQLIYEKRWTVYPENGILDTNGNGGGYQNIKFMGMGYMTSSIGGWDEERRVNRSFLVLHHRIIHEWRTEEYVPTEDGMVIDHINRIPHDNRAANLRAVTMKENLLNRLGAAEEVFEDDEDAEGGQEEGSLP